MIWFGAQGVDTHIQSFQTPGTTSLCPCLPTGVLLCWMLSTISLACPCFRWNRNSDGSVFGRVSLRHIIVAWARGGYLNKLSAVSKGEVSICVRRDLKKKKKKVVALNTPPYIKKTLNATLN